MNALDLNQRPAWKFFFVRFFSIFWDSRFVGNVAFHCRRRAGKRFLK